MCQVTGLHVKWSLSLKDLINKFSSQKSPFFVSQFTITWPRIPKIGTHDAFINSYAECEFQLSWFYRLQVISKSIHFCKNSLTKTKVLRAPAKYQ